MLKKAIEANTYNSQFFIYTDAGAWREKVYPNWPDVDFVKQVSDEIKDLPLFGQVGFCMYNFPVNFFLIAYNIDIQEFT